MSLRGKPVVLVSDLRNRREITALSGEAEKFGIRRGMTLAQARALCAHVISIDHDFARDQKSLEALGYWLVRFTPTVMVDSGAIFLDLTGCERLFGGLANLVQQIQSSLKQFKIGARLAIAPTPGAAWALTFLKYKEKKPQMNTDEHRWKNGGLNYLCSSVFICGSLNDLPQALSELAVIALRVEPEIAESLHHLGIETIGQLMGMPRELLPVRFGDELIQRLDQALGNINEPLVPLPARHSIEAQVQSDFPIHSLEAIWLIFRKLVERIVLEMDRRGVGARTIDLVFKQHYAPVISKTIELTRPSRDAAEIFNLLRCAQEGMPSIEGIVGVSLKVTRAQKMGPEQIRIMGDEDFAAQRQLSRLVERLSVRMGNEAVGAAELVESYLPEQAWNFRGMGFQPMHKTTRAGSPCHVRPLRLLNEPVEIRVMVSPSEDREGWPILFTYGEQRRVRHAVGPERIAGPWWEGRNKTRDYFDVEDEQGKRWWMFRVRETGRWYVQGMFE